CGELLEKIERAQQERLAAQRIAVDAKDAELSDVGGSAAVAVASESSLSSALGSTLAQLLRRPEIVIEDLAAVIAQGYPEYFAEIAAHSNEDAAGAAAEQPQGLKPTPL